MKTEFLKEHEKKIMDQFLEQGFAIVPVADPSLLLEIKKELFSWSSQLLGLDPHTDIDHFFDYTQEYIAVKDLNDFRVQMIQKLTAWTELRPTLYHLGKEFIDCIVGNELAMQRTVNLSVQLPHDKSSLLPLHTDVWSGNSPYEIVFWLPLVNCHKTKSMFIMPYQESQKIVDNFPQYSNLHVEDLYQKIKHTAIELTVPFGSAAIFSHSLLHGNRINLEDQARWTFNVRFKSLLSPYGSKELGETFLPITIKPMTRIGFNYRKPTL